MATRDPTAELLRARAQRKAVLRLVGDAMAEGWRIERVSAYARGRA